MFTKQLENEDLELLKIQVKHTLSDPCFEKIIMLGRQFLNRD